jgi:integrase
MGVRVRQKKKGRGNPWWVFITHNGKRTSRQVGDKAAAETVASKIRAKLQLNQFEWEPEPKKPEPEKPLFKDIATGYIEITVPATCKESTTYDYTGILKRHVLPVFEDMPIDEINSGVIKSFLFSKVNEGFSASTVSHTKNIISGVFTDAVDNELIDVNPALSLGRNFMQKITDVIQSRKVSEGIENEGQADPLSAEELKLFLNAVARYYPDHHPLFLLLARTGCRIGEALGLKWGDIDFNGRFINLSRGYSRGRISTLKNKRKRQVDMSLQLAETLEAYRVQCKKKGLTLGLGDEPEWVFSNSRGNPIEASNWRRRVFNKALKKAKLRKIRIHDTRHTYATLRIAKGDNIADVSHQLGHHSPKFTMDFYYHWMPGKKKGEVDGLDDPEFRDEENEVQEEEAQEHAAAA